MPLSPYRAWEIVVSLTPRFTPWATFCRPIGLENRHEVVGNTQAQGRRGRAFRKHAQPPFPMQHRFRPSVLLATRLASSAAIFDRHGVLAATVRERAGKNRFLRGAASNADFRLRESSKRKSASNDRQRHNQRPPDLESRATFPQRSQSKIASV